MTQKEDSGALLRGGTLRGTEDAYELRAGLVCAKEIIIYLGLSQQLQSPLHLRQLCTPF